MLGLVDAVERPQHRLQCRSLDLQRLRHGQLALFRVRLPFRPAPALGLQPAIELIEAGEPQPGLEEATPDRLHLVLDLTLLPSRRRRAGGRLDHIMRSEEHTSELQSLMRISYAVFCLQKQT